ncbi:MAG: hypothetical protein DRP08_05870, partial [Candidatus Aenigmatarchaeota archaeon]
MFGERELLRRFLEALSELKGADDKDFSTLEADIESILTNITSIRTQTDKLQFDVDNNLKINLTTSEIIQPVEPQSHWAEAVTLLASGARTASGNGDDVDVGRFIVGELCINVTEVSGTFAAGEGLRVIVEGKDEVSRKYKVIYDSYDSLGGMITSPTTDWLT